MKKIIFYGICMLTVIVGFIYFQCDVDEPETVECVVGGVDTHEFQVGDTLTVGDGGSLIKRQDSIQPIVGIVRSSIASIRDTLTMDAMAEEYINNKYKYYKMFIWGSFDGVHYSCDDTIFVKSDEIIILLREGVNNLTIQSR